MGGKWVSVLQDFVHHVNSGFWAFGTKNWNIVCSGVLFRGFCSKMADFPFKLSDFPFKFSDFPFQFSNFPFQFSDSTGEHQEISTAIQAQHSALSP